MNQETPDPNRKGLSFSSIELETEVHFFITTGPTREPIDPVRYLSNRSSGKMGHALANAAIRAGHQVTLVSGPVSLDAPADVRIVRVETAQQMWEATRDALANERFDVAILAAAVADYRPVAAQTQKIKKQADTLTLELERTPDILGSMRSVFGFDGWLVGFAAETENLIENAQSKLRRKGCDLVIANDVGRKDTGFDSDDNEVVICHADGHTEPIPKMSKDELAAVIVQKCVALKASQLPAGR